MRDIKTILTLVALFMVATSSAQNISDFRAKLSDPLYNVETERTSNVETEHSDEAAAVVDALSAQSSTGTRFQGYRLGIYSDNGPDAQETSLAAKTTFESNFPDINVYWVYDNPYFKVTAGDCLTEEEAVMLLARVRTLFPKAYVMRAMMTAENIILPKPQEILPEDETAEGENGETIEGEQSEQTAEQSEQEISNNTSTTLRNSLRNRR